MNDNAYTNPAVAGAVSWEMATHGPPPDYEHFPEVRAGINAKPLPSPTGPRREITEAQKIRLYRDGFLVIKQAVPLELTRDARETANDGPPTRFGIGERLMQRQVPGLRQGLPDQAHGVPNRRPRTSILGSTNPPGRSPSC